VLSKVRGRMSELRPQRPSSGSAVGSRTYVSHLRDSQARATRRAIVAAAAEMFVEVGYSAATIAAIAERAGVSRRTVFSSVGGKPALLKLAWDWAVAGDDEPVAMADRPAVHAMLAQTDPAALVRMWVGFVTDVVSRVAAIGHVLDVAADLDPDAAKLLAKVEQQRLQGARSFVDQLAGIGGLRKGVTRVQAADWCWANMSPTLYRKLVVEQGWSPAVFQRWLVRSIAATLLAPQ
jgi:AcrR family transcriptional regulator